MAQAAFLAMLGGLLGIALYIAVIIAIFLLIRALWLWYWRVNHIVRVLEESRDSLQVIAQYTQPRGDRHQ
jgi:hypothetical protein